MHSEVQIISVLGPPGSGKGSQCSRLQEDYQCTHLSVGDLLRAEIKKGGPFAEIIQENMSCGRIGPKDLTAQIMKENIEKSLKRGITTIFLDGFPRRLDQADYFEEHLFPLSISLVLVLDCPYPVLLKRLSSRRREDDNTETIAKRMDTFEQTTAKVLEKYEAIGKVMRVNGDDNMENVASNLKETLHRRGIVLREKTRS